MSKPVGHGIHHFGLEQQNKFSVQIEAYKEQLLEIAENPTQEKVTWIFLRVTETKTQITQLKQEYSNPTLNVLEFGTTQLLTRIIQVQIRLTYASCKESDRKDPQPDFSWGPTLAASPGPLASIRKKPQPDPSGDVDPKLALSPGPLESIHAQKLAALFGGKKDVVGQT